MEQRGEFRADRASADDRDRLRQFRLRRDVIGCDDPPTVGHEAGQALDAAARGDDHVLGRNDALAAAGPACGPAVFGNQGNPNRGRSLEPGAPGDPGHLVLVDKTLQARPHPLHDLVAAFRDRLVVEAGLTLEQEPELPGLLEAGKKLGRLEERLGRNAAEVQESAADLALVDEGDVHAQLGGPEGGRVAARAGAKYDQVKVGAGACGHGMAASRYECWVGWTCLVGRTGRPGIVSGAAGRGNRPHSVERRVEQPSADRTTDRPHAAASSNVEPILRRRIQYARYAASSTDTIGRN